MNFQAMTKEKLQLLLPVVFTIGPNMEGRGKGHGPEDGDPNLLKYSMLLAAADGAQKTEKAHLESIIKGIIEGETRVLVSAMSKFCSFIWCIGNGDAQPSTCLPPSGGHLDPID